jgi:16S rRNA processing protein RimM
LKTQGRRGEVVVEVLSNVPRRFVEGLRLLALAEDGSRRELQVETLWPHQGRLVLKFAGVDSISAAEGLSGCELQVPRDQRGQLESGWTYVSDLVGCTVFDGDSEIGRIDDVQFGAGEAPLLIVKAGSNDYEIPYAEAYLEKADLEHKRIQMRLPEGMLELNAPLTEEEKDQQAGRSRSKKA